MPSQHGHHIIQKATLYKVFGSLVALTILTGLTAEFVDIGAFNIPLALAIAASKATLVATFFMALKYDNKVNTLVFLLGIIFVGIFLIFTLFDTVFRGDLGNVGSERISDTERREDLLRQQEPGIPADTAAVDPLPGSAEQSTADQNEEAGIEAADDASPATSDTADTPEMDGNAAP